MAAIIDRPVVLPSGEKIVARVPEDWSPEQVRSALESRGVSFDAPKAQAPADNAPDPSTVDKLLYGAAKVTPLIGEAKNFIEQQIGQRPDQTVTKQVSTTDLPPTIDPVTGQADFGPTKTVTETIKGRTAEDIRKEQAAAKDLALAVNFPTIHGTKHENDTAVKVGEVARYATDLITVPIPTAKAGELFALVKAGKPVMSSAEGLATVGKAALEGSLGATAFAGADNSLRQMADKGEIDAKELGHVALVSAAGGAIAGPLISTVGGRFAKWMYNRRNVKAPVTADEVNAVAGGSVDPAQAAQLAEAMNKVSDRAKVEAATIDALYPAKTSRSITEGGKAPKLTKEEKQLRADIRDAFKQEAATADALQHHADVIAMDREARAALPLEVRRARDALDRRITTDELRRAGRTPEVDAAAAARVRARQEAELAKLEAERTTPATQPVADRMEAAQIRHQDEIAGRNLDQYRTKQDRIPVTQTWAQKTAKRMEQIAPRIATAVRKSTIIANRRTTDAVKRVLPWAFNKEMRKLVRTNMEYRAAVLNRDTEAMNRLLPGSGDTYQNTVAPLLDEYRATLKAEGRPIIDDGIHPRAVHNVTKLRKQLGRAGNEKLDDLLIKLAKSKNKSVDQLGEHEIAGLIGQVAAGHKHKEFRGRTITEVTPEAAKWYTDPVDTLLDYIHRVEEDKATKAFFKDTLNQDVKIGDALKKDQLEGHLGMVLAKGLKAGDLNTRDIADLAELLDVHFGISRGGPSHFQRNVKDIFTAMTLGYNPFSTVTQLGDLGVIGAKTGATHLAGGVREAFGQNASKLYESGLRNLASELRTNQGVARFTKRSLEDFGFARLDLLGNKAAMNAVLRQRTAQALKDPAKFAKEIEPLFGKSATEQMMADLRAGNYSDDVATLIAHDVADIRPISREDMPLGWNKDPHGRLKYSLLSWSINQMNFARSRYLNHLDNAVRLAGRGKAKAAASEAGKFAKGFAAMTLFFALANVPPGMIKDAVRGKPLDPVAYAAAGAIPFGMSAKFAGDILSSARPEALVGRMVPYYGIGLQGLGALWRAGTQGDFAALANLSPTIRSLGQLMTGLGLVTVKDANAAFAVPEQYDAAKGATPLAPQPVPAENNLPAGAVALQDPFGGGPRTRPVLNRPAEQFAAAKDLLVKREGDVGSSYKDKLGKLTGGIGHLLTKAERAKYPEGTEIPRTVRDQWFKQDSAKAFNAARKQAKELGRPDMVPALASVNFQLGTEWNKEHKKTWKLLKDGQWLEAAAEAEKSKWAEQTPVRVKDFQDAIRQAIK